MANALYKTGETGTVTSLGQYTRSGYTSQRGCTGVFEGWQNLAESTQAFLQKRIVRRSPACRICPEAIKSPLLCRLSYSLKLFCVKSF